MRKKLSITMFVALALLSAFGMAGCTDGGEKNYRAIPYYDSCDYLDGSDLAHYNNNLFRRNDNSGIGADPAVIRVTDPESPDYGDFFMYKTSMGFVCYQSEDLVTWTARGTVLSDAAAATGCFYGDNWAPEVVYDEEDGLYYMFCSATPQNGNGTNGLLYCLSSENPYGPFDLVDLSGQNRAESYVRANGTTVEYNDYWADLVLFDPAKYAARVEDFLIEYTKNNALYDNYTFNGYFSNIDPYPFVDDDGTRYLYFVFRNYGTRYIGGVECGDSWTDIKYETLTLLTMAGYMDVQGTTPCEYANNVLIDEGPVMIKHNGIYYLTYSFGAADGDYRVAQAVSDSPLGVFRKLGESENAIFLSNDSGGFDISGPGGHSFVEADGELYIVYHRHMSSSAPDINSRTLAVDKVKWVTIENIEGEKMDVLYANGPTVNLQPKFEFASEYKNIAGEAQVSAENMQEGSSAAALTDDLLSMYQYESPTFNETYIHETYFGDTATITLSFQDYRTVRAVMVYNSKSLTTAFLQIKRIEFDCIDAEGNEVTNYIANLQFDWRENRHSLNPDFGLKNASAAIAEFDEIRCRQIRITVEIPESGWLIGEDGSISYAEEDYMMFKHEGRVGISEIVVLGK